MARPVWNVVLVSLVVIGVLLLIGTGLYTGLLPTDREVRIVGAPVCQGVNGSGVDLTVETEDVAFTGITIANQGRGVVYRARANIRSEYDVAGRLLPDNCQVGFDGFCIGQASTDYTGGQALDQIWFILSEDTDEEGQAHYVHGGVVQELAPGTIGRRPDRCEGGAAEPRAIELVEPLTAAEPGYSLRFTAPDAVTVGAAARTSDSADGSRWRQVGLDTTAEDGFSLTWSRSDTSQPASIVYTVCWSGNVPGRARGAIDITPGPVARTAASDLSREDLREAAAVACNDTGGGT